MSHSPKRSSWLLLASSFVILHSSFSQTASEPNEGLRITGSTLNPGGFELSWYGRSGRAYFILQSDDDMESWAHVPMMEAGIGAAIQWGLDSSASRSFFKVQWLDGYDIGTAGQTDSDLDGVSDLDELLTGTDPFETPEPETPPLDSDNDGVPDDLDMVAYDSAFIEPPSMSPSRYAVIDLGVGIVPRMGANGHMYWRRHLIGDYAAWPNNNGSVVIFTSESLLGGAYDTPALSSISPTGVICGVTKDEDLRPYAVRFTPGFSAMVHGAYGADHAKLSGLCGWGPADQIYGSLEWGTFGSPSSVGFRGVGVYSNGYQSLRVVDGEDEPEAAPIPEPPPMPGEVLQYYAGLAADRFASTGSDKMSRGGLIESVRETSAHAYDSYFLDEFFAITWSREYGPLVSDTQHCWVRTAAGQVIDLGGRNLLTQAEMLFTSVSTHQPVPWLSGPSTVPDPAWMEYSPANHIWLPTGGGFSVQPIYASEALWNAGTELDFIYRLNGQGMALVQGTMKDGSYDFGVWANGEATALPDLIDETDWDQYQPSSWIMYGFSDSGMIAARATQFADNKPHILALIPGESITGELGTEEERGGAWLMTEARPKPEVKLYITGTQMTATGVQVSLRGTVYDELSGLATNAGDRVASLNFSVFGQSLGSIGLGSAVGQGQSFSYTAQIPHAQAMSYTIRAETSANKAGEKGWDEVAVSVGYVGSFSSGGTASQMHVLFGSAPTDTSVDTAVVYFGSSGSSGATVTETGVNTGEFVGNAIHPSGVVPCTLQLRLPSSLNAAQPETLAGVATLTLPTGVSEIACSLVETGADTRIFAVPAGTQLFDAGSLKVVTTSNLRGEQAEKGLTPFTIRIGAPAGIAAGGASLSINGVNFSLQEFTHNGRSYLYPVNGSGEPRYFLPATGPVPSHLSIPGYVATGQTQTLEFRFHCFGQQSIIASVQVQPGSNDSYGSAASGQGGNPAAPGAHWQQPGDTVTMDDLLLAFKILYGDQGQDLLFYFEQGDGVIQLGDVLGDLDIDVLNVDQKTYIQIEDDDLEVAGTKYNPAVAAQLLWNGLNQCLAYHHIRVNIPVTDLNALIQAQQAVSQQAAQVGIAAGELYLSGIGIASDGVDLILTINEVAEGNYVALAGALPFIPTSLFASSGRLLMRNAAGKLLGKVDNPAELEILQQIYTITDPDQRLHVLGTVLDSNDFGLAIGRVMTSGNGPIKIPGAQETLKKRMGKLVPKPSVLHEAHHDLIWTEKIWFAQHGIDVNNVAFGRWVDSKTHHLWHDQMVPRYNDFWEAFIDHEKELPAPYSKQQILDKLAEARSIYSLPTP